MAGPDATMSLFMTSGESRTGKDGDRCKGRSGWRERGAFGVNGFTPEWDEDIFYFLKVVDALDRYKK